MKKNAFTKKMNMGKIIEKFPQSGDIMAKHGIHCIGCHMSPYETLEAGCKSHGMNDKDIDKIIKEINEVYQKSLKKNNK